MHLYYPGIAYILPVWRFSKIFGSFTFVILSWPLHSHNLGLWDSTIKLTVLSRGTHRKGHNTKQGILQSLSNSPLLASLWIDKQTLYLLSSFPFAEPPSTVKKTRIDGSQVNVSCTLCLVNYQAYMHGVDKGKVTSGRRVFEC